MAKGWTEEGLPASARATAERVRDVAFRLHRAIGPRYRESTYHRFLAHGLRNTGLRVEERVSFDVEFGGLRIERARGADLLVEGELVVEVKAVEHLLPVHRAQIIGYLTISGMPAGLLINFNSARLVEGCHWFVHPRFLRRIADHEEK